MRFLLFLVFFFFPQFNTLQLKHGCRLCFGVLQFFETFIKSLDTILLAALQELMKIEEESEDKYECTL